ncbi:MAG: DUF6879 family protein [Egibacteraceae bacterium]
MAYESANNRSGVVGSPHFHRGDDPSKLLVQGWRIADPGFELPDGEATVEVPTVLALDAVCQLDGQVTRTDLIRMLRLFSTSSFRLETLQRYTEDSETARLASYAATGQIDPHDPGTARWTAMVAAHLTAGKGMRRVHLVRQPLSDYLRWEFAFQTHTGEDVRVADLGTYPELADHPGDSWLFDNRVGVRMVYDDDARLVACERIGEDGIDACRIWRDRAWAAAAPLADSLDAARAV